MKCPKCGYLGFETTDRCKNCGYDFSLIATPPAAGTPIADLTIRTGDEETGPPEVWLDRIDRSLDEPGSPKPLDRPLRLPPELRRSSDAPEPAALPLFNPDGPDDIPLIALPAAPRPPLAVRRTPEAPRLRGVLGARRAPNPALEFIGAAPLEPFADFPHERESRIDADDELDDFVNIHVAGRRVVAAVIDHLILGSIDLLVVYFTIRMAGLNVSEIRTLPLAPLLTFLILLKFAYFTAFTAIGGQTIGKMAAGIQVVTDTIEPVDSGCAVRRTMAGILSFASLGLGLLPAFVGDRRALHDRLAHTRVVSVSSV
jgi:uncharacterized RDD family membrane protein YckC